MRAPRGLGNPGKAMWKAHVDDLPEGLEFDARDLANLGLAARQADSLAVLETAIKRDGTMVTGSKGQRVLNPAIAEARQARMTISKLLGTIHIPDVDAAVPQTAAAKRAQHAAQARWSRQADRRATRKADRGAA